MAINKKFTEYELEIIKLALNQLDLTGKIDVACPRCAGKLVGTSVSTSYSIECENKCGIKASARGIQRYVIIISPKCIKNCVIYIIINIM